jgi:hypothetical protein
MHELLPTGYSVSALEFEAMQGLKASARGGRAIADMSENEIEQMAAGRNDRLGR